MDPFIEVKNDVIDLVARKYERTEESLQEDVAILRTWMEAQPHLPEILDDKAISNFLILNKCSVEQSKQRIDMYYTIRSKFPDIMENINPKCSNMKQYLNIGCTVPLPNMTKEMYRILLYKMFDKNLIDKQNPYDVLKHLIVLQELRLHEDVMFGDIFIFDMDGIDFAYILKWTPALLTKVFIIYEKVYSIPLKAMYFINCPSYIDTLLSIFKRILKPKIFDRVCVCEDTKILENVSFKECLPKEYGGEAKSVEELCEIYKMKIEQYQDRFDLLDKLRVNESLRPEKLENDDLLGFHGNFRLLNVD